ncbi:MAG: L7Ae/L30e/S12e/Gadd45 family ribosomal protein [Fastidiosipilaceae bacterium]|jgi:ribosomal protein L7Ae-like RNA K-turn-binding protein
MNKDSGKALRLTGLCNRAGAVTAGMDAALRVIANRDAKLVLLAVDMSDGSRSKVMRAALKANVPFVTLGDRWELGRYTGSGQCVVAVIRDRDFAAGVLTALGKDPASEGGGETADL